MAPRIAASLLRDRLARDGRVLDAQVSAVPWLELLWGDADAVRVRLARYRTPGPGSGGLRRLLEEARGLGTLEVSVGVLRTGLVTLREVRLTERAGRLVGSARLQLADLRAALPFVRSLTPVSAPGGPLVLRGTASLLGLAASVELTVAARAGALVVAPTGLLAPLATVTVFRDPRLRVRSVRAVAVPGGVRFVVGGRFA